jgi:hypothetical protein
MQEIKKFCDEELLKDLGIRNFDIESRILPQYALYSQKYGVTQLHHATLKVHNYKVSICS